MAISSYATLQIGLMLAYNLGENATAFEYVTVVFFFFYKQRSFACRLVFHPYANRFLGQ